jgi:hypothetical protein
MLPNELGTGRKKPNDVILAVPKSKLHHYWRVID